VVLLRQIAISAGELQVRQNMVATGRKGLPVIELELPDNELRTVTASIALFVTQYMQKIIDRHGMGLSAVGHGAAHTSCRGNVDATADKRIGVTD
jgi:hypothetical protein